MTFVTRHSRIVGCMNIVIEPNFTAKQRDMAGELGITISKR